MNYLRPTFVAQDVEMLTPAVANRYAINTIAFDVDGTLSNYHAHELEPTVRDALGELGSAGIKLFIVSNAYDERAEELASIYCEVVPEANVITPASVAPEGEKLSSYRKPSPAMLRHVVELSQDKPTHTLMVGDQLLKDIISANRAGTKSLLLPRRGTGDHPAVRFQRVPETILRAGLSLPVQGNRFISNFPEEVTPTR